MQNRPNILIISADQHRADCLGVAGRRVKTPHLDALAKSGTRFGSCISPSVACQPARASILTGQLCRTHGVQDDGMDLDPTIGEKGFAGTLANSGYDTALFGKAHFSTYHPRAPSGTPECLRSSAKYDSHWHGPYMGFEHVELTLQAKNGFAPETPPRGQHYERFFHADKNGEHKQAQYGKDKGSSSKPNVCWHSGLTPADHSTPWTADRAIDWLRHGRTSEKPFCSWVSFADLQHPYDCPEPWSRLHDPRDVDLPAHRTLAPDSLPWWYQSALMREDSLYNNNEVRGILNKKNDSESTKQSDKLLREIIANAYGKIAFIDNQVGRLMNTLAELDLSETTHVFYLSDHGDWLGDHGLTMKGPMFYDCLLRVPLIWRGPDVPKNRINYEPVSTIDLSPSIIELAEVQPQLQQHGESLRPLLDGQSKRDFAMSEWELLPGRVDATVSLRSVRTRTYKLTKDMNSGHGELYDLLADPNEMHNLFDDPASTDIRIRLESYLMMRTQDVATRKAA
ncbi:MAG: sulfatase [Granulosicoccus sp.]